MLRKDTIAALNAQYRDAEIVLKDDIKADFAAATGKEEAIFRKGNKIRIWFEVSHEWVKVRATLADQGREQASGHVILYLFAEDLQEDEDPAAVLDAKLRTKLGLSTQEPNSPGR